MARRRIRRPTIGPNPASTPIPSLGDITMDRTTIQAAIYARVSSDQQAQEHTIDSQVEALTGRAREDGLVVEDSLRFIDAGQSGAHDVAVQRGEGEDHHQPGHRAA